jgi:hypothetical protein
MPRLIVQRHNQEFPAANMASSARTTVLPPGGAPIVGGILRVAGLAGEFLGRFQR